MKTLKLTLALVGFIAAAGLAAVLGADKLPKTQRISITVRNCEYEVDGAMTVKKGQNVSLTATSEEGGEFHIHGYELKKSLADGQKATFNFRAVQSGIFDVEMHDCEEHVMLTVLNEDGTEPSIPAHEDSTDHSEADTLDEDAIEEDIEADTNAEDVPHAESDTDPDYDY